MIFCADFWSRKHNFILLFTHAAEAARPAKMTTLAGLRTFVGPPLFEIVQAPDRDVNRGGGLEQDDSPLVTLKTTTKPGTKGPAPFGRCIQNRDESDQNFDCAIEPPGNFSQPKE